MKDFLKNMLLVLKKVLNLFIFPKVLLIYANYIAVPLPKSPKGVTRIQIFIRRMNETVAETDDLFGRFPKDFAQYKSKTGHPKGKWHPYNRMQGGVAVKILSDLLCLDSNKRPPIQTFKIIMAQICVFVNTNLCHLL